MFITVRYVSKSGSYRLTPTNLDSEELLAHLVRLLAKGGKLTIDTNGHNRKSVDIPPSEKVFDTSAYAWLLD